MHSTTARTACPPQTTLAPCGGVLSTTSNLPASLQTRCLHAVFMPRSSEAMQASI